jgi:multiple sugar transport system ATP-binding protein
MRVELKLLQRRLRTTTVYVTHDQTEAMTLADRIAVMEDGRVGQCGTPQEVFDTPADRFVAGFIGSPAMNFLAGKVVASGGGATIRTASMEVAPGPALGERLAAFAGADVTVGFRPGDVGVGAGAANGFGGKVEVVEHLGTEKFAYVRTPDGVLTVRVAADEAVREGDQGAFGVRADRVHVFGPDGMNVLHG